MRRNRLQEQKARKEIPPYGVLIGRMIFIGGLVLALFGAGFLLMLGIAAGSGLGLLFFGAIFAGGCSVAWLAMRDLTGPAIEQEAVIIERNQHREGGNPNYSLKFRLLNQDLSPTAREISYNVTEQDWARFEVNDRVTLRYSRYFKLFINIRSAAE